MFSDEQLETFEQVGAAAAALIILVCTLGSPRSSRSLTREELARVCVRGNRQVAQLESSLLAAQGSAEAQKAEIAGANNSFAKVREQMASLEKERETLKGQIAQGATKIKDLEGQIAAARTENAKLSNKAATEDILKERDAALARADKDEDRIRELTLQLHRAGIWP